jgi:DNA-binding transcriptional LysR family regulator
MDHNVTFERLVARLRLRHMRLIREIGVWGSLRTAAEKVGIAQPAASQIVHEVETLIGTPLFVRSRQGMEPTPVGQELLRYVHNAMGSLHACARNMDDLLAGHELQLHVGGIPACGPALFAPAFARLMKRRPKARISLVELTERELMGGLSSGEFDLILAREPALLPQGFMYEPLYPDEAVLVVAPGHPFARRKRLELGELRGQPWFLPAASFPMGKLFSAWLEASEIGLVQAQIECTLAAILPSVLESSGAVGMVPKSIVIELLALRSLIALPIELDVPMKPIVAVYARARAEEPRLRDFLDCLRAEAAGEGAGT